MTATAANQQTTTSQQKPKPPSLRVQRGGNAKPPRVLIYGPEGVGKSCLAADFGNSIVISVEDGTDRIDVDQFQFDDNGRTRPSSLAEVYGALRALYENKHDYTAVILDGLDELERLIFESLYRGKTNSRGEEYKSIEDFGYGKGYAMAVEEWRRLASSLEHLRGRGLAVVLVGHCQVTTFQNPLGDDYDRFDLLLHKKAAPVLKGWSDFVLFMHFEDVVGTKPANSDKTLATETGRRMLHLERSAAFDAKARGDHPPSIEIPKSNPWAPVAEALSIGGKK